ncbi:CDK5RAP1-like protein [Halyomorpha halys]|uniref:CDK5RAP1-like protein n=1 Tax=Halyomorpha halys TaxID=286706 RepID=UPI0006D517D4
MNIIRKIIKLNKISRSSKDLAPFSSHGFQYHYSSNARPSKLPDGPDLKQFILGSLSQTNINIDENEHIPYLNETNYGLNRKVYIDVYGCQMNVNDTEIVWSILESSGYVKTNKIQEADVILLMTCAIRENAESKVWNKLNHLKHMKTNRPCYKKKPTLKLGILGCMAERLKHQLIEKEQSIDIVAGPDSYKDLPRLLAVSENNQTAVNVMLSQDETYADVIPVRINKDSISAFVSIMRGCDNMCTYCIVPFTRGRERSRPISSILQEVEYLSRQGVKEVTLLGQNVNSYRDVSMGIGDREETKLASGFKTVYKLKKGGLRFAELLKKVAEINPQMRVRFTSPHPKDFPDEVLEVLISKPNVCLNLHLPAQSGSTSVLERMRRGYSREAYLKLVEHVKAKLPGVTLSSDFICGFCGETDEEFAETLSLMEIVQYNIAYLFAYSMREKTTAHRRYIDDIPPDIKKARLIEMAKVYRKFADKQNSQFVGKEQTILIEGLSKRSNEYLAGKNDGNIKVIIPSGSIPSAYNSGIEKTIEVGDYISVKVTEANSQVLKGIPLYHTALPS